MCLCLRRPAGNVSYRLLLLSFLSSRVSGFMRSFLWQPISLEDQGPGVFPSYPQRSHPGVICLPWSHVAVSEDIFRSYMCRKRGSPGLAPYYRSFNCGSEDQLKLRVLRVRKGIIAGVSSCQWGLGLSRELGLFHKMSQGRLCGHVPCVYRRGGKEGLLLTGLPPPPCLTLSSQTQLCGLSPTLYNLRATATPALRVTVTSTRRSWKEPRVPGAGKASACDRNRDLAMKSSVAEVTFPRSLDIYFL